MLEIFPGLLIPAIVTALSLVLALNYVIRPGRARQRAGMLTGFVALVAVPALSLLVGSERHLQLSKKTEFCLSCHEMHPYGAALLKDEEELLTAIHFANHYVPPDAACYSCHTQYTLYGGAKAKLKGLQHVWVHFFETIEDPIELYEPYNNRECLHCHEGAKSFDEAMLHAETLPEFRANEKSCLECHGPAHDVEEGAVTAAVEGTREFPHPARKAPEEEQGKEEGQDERERAEGPEDGE